MGFPLKLQVRWVEKKLQRRVMSEIERLILMLLRGGLPPEEEPNCHPGAGQMQYRVSTVFP